MGMRRRWKNYTKCYSIMELIRKFFFKYIHDNWNIGIADIGDDLSPLNIKWMKHEYKDRCFADPFFVEKTKDAYIILVEELVRDARKGRLARLTVDIEDCRLLKNETILDLPTHLSFPNPIVVDEKTYIYPENGASGNTKYYEYDTLLRNPQLLSNLPLTDAVIYRHEDKYYLLYTLGKECNGNVLHVAVADSAFGEYKPIQEITFADNVARRAGNVFQWKGRSISPAQVNNNHYGEGASFQEIAIENGLVSLREIKRIFPSWHEYDKAFHTYNVLDNKVVIDGVRIGWPKISRIYRKLLNYYAIWKIGEPVYIVD